MASPPIASGSRSRLAIGRSISCWYGSTIRTPVRFALFSSESLAQVPALSRSQQETFVERLMPSSLVARSFWGVSLAQWIVWARLDRSSSAVVLDRGTLCWRVFETAHPRHNAPHGVRGVVEGSAVGSSSSH